MRRGFVAYAAVAAVVIGAGPALAAKPLPGCGPDVYVNTIVKGTAIGAYEIVSDGNESYPHGGSGQNKITGRFQVDNCTHDFTLNLHLSSRYMVGLLEESPGSPGVITSKFFNFDRVASVPVTPGPESVDFGTTGWCAGGVVRTSDGRIRKNADGTYQDNYAGCGQDPDGTWFVRRAATLPFYEGPSRDYYLYFQRSPLDGSGFCDNRPEACAEAVDHVRVYHPTPSTWILRPEGEGWAALVRNGTEGGFLGYEAVPFEIVVTRP